jgi:hypothetical protein
MSNWPAELPQKQFLGTTIQDDESRIIQTMDAGPASVRNRFTAITQSVNCPIVLTGAQRAIFNTFYRTTLNHGTNSFTWTDPTTDQSVTFRFKRPPTWQAISPGSVNNRIWRSNLELEILP